jgi:hypothetical protein
MSKMNMGTILQVILASIIVVIIYIITLVVLNIDSIVVKANNRVKPRETTVIVDGYAPVSSLAGRTYNTYNSLVDNFRKIGRSINSMGGSQFTYQFWLKIDDPNDDYFKNLVVLLKGDNRQYKVGLYDPVDGSKKVENPPDYVIACPLIKFVDSYRHLRVQFNTMNNPVTSVDINMNPGDNTQGRRNALSLLPLSWYMLTFVFEDNVSNQSFAENGINIKFWLNDFPYQEMGASTEPSLQTNTFKQNDGNLYLFPSVVQGNSFLKVGNLKYFNYSLTEQEIQRAYKAGPPTKASMETRGAGGDSKPPYLSAYNKIDVYNY